MLCLTWQEPNVWGCAGSACVELSFVSAPHAFRAFRATHPSCADSNSNPPITTGLTDPRHEHEQQHHHPPHTTPDGRTPGATAALPPPAGAGAMGMQQEVVAHIIALMSVMGILGLIAGVVLVIVQILERKCRRREHEVASTLSPSRHALLKE